MMSDRERWIVYPLLLALMAGVAGPLFAQQAATDEETAATGESEPDVQRGRHVYADDGSARSDGQGEQPGNRSGWRCSDLSLDGAVWHVQSC